MRPSPANDQLGLIRLLSAKLNLTGAVARGPTGRNGPTGLGPWRGGRHKNRVGLPVAHHWRSGRSCRVRVRVTPRGMARDAAA